MAKGSEQFTWGATPKEERVCRKCERELLIRDVAEVRVIYPSTKKQFLCTTCKLTRVEEMIRETRKNLGLQERT